MQGCPVRRRQNAILWAVGNTLTAATNNATDASQALAMAAAAQGQMQRGFENLGMAEAQDQQRRMTNWEQALQGQIGEEQNVFNMKFAASETGRRYKAQ